MLCKKPPLRLTHRPGRLRQTPGSEAIPFGFLEDADHYRGFNAARLWFLEDGVHYRGFNAARLCGFQQGRLSSPYYRYKETLFISQLLRSKTIPRRTYARYFIYAGHHDQDQRSTA